MIVSARMVLPSDPILSQWNGGIIGGYSDHPSLSARKPSVAGSLLRRYGGWGSAKTSFAGVHVAGDELTSYGMLVGWGAQSDCGIRGVFPLGRPDACAAGETGPMLRRRRNGRQVGRHRVRRTASRKMSAGTGRTTSSGGRGGAWIRAIGGELATVLLVAALVVLFLSPILHVPFVGRDEAVYAYFGQHASSTHVLYRDFWDTHFPGLYYVYAIGFHAPGGGMQTVRIIHLVYQILCILAFYLLLRRILRPVFARIGAIVYAVYAVSPALQGENANAEPFLLLPVFLALYFSLLRTRAADFGAGFLLGIAILFKQHAIFLLAVPVLAAILEPNVLRGFSPLRKVLRRSFSRVPLLLLGLARSGGCRLACTCRLPGIRRVRRLHHFLHVP